MDRICTTCREAKAPSDFNKCAKTADGLAAKCRACSREYARAYYTRRWGHIRKRDNTARLARSAAERRAIGRRQKLAKHGLTPEAFDEILNHQNGGCALCATTEPGGRWKQFFVDHDHRCCPGQYSCGKCVRGLLCYHCNLGLGHFFDRGDLLLAAITYLESGSVTEPTLNEPAILFLEPKGPLGFAA